MPATAASARARTITGVLLVSRATRAKEPPVQRDARRGELHDAAEDRAEHDGRAQDDGRERLARDARRSAVADAAAAVAVAAGTARY
jgi:hypothetical protein